MPSVDTSQLLVEPTTLASVGDKVTRHETVALLVNRVVLLVLAVTHISNGRPSEVQSTSRP